MVRKRQVSADELDIPPFLRRKGGGFEKAFGGGARVRLEVSTDGVKDPHAALHAKAAELGLKRHQYQVHWLLDAKWVEFMEKNKAERDAKKAEQAAIKAKNRELDRENREHGPKRAKRTKKLVKLASELPSGTIAVVDKVNPRTEGSTAHERYERLLKYDGKTVADYLAAGCHPAALVRAIKEKRVKVKEKKNG